VLHSLSWIAGGGVERRRLLLARLLDRRRYEQRIVARSCKHGVAEALRAEGIEVIEIGDGRVFEPRVMMRAIRAAREFRPHIVHGAVFEGVAAAVVAGRACGAKVIVEETSHATNRSRAGHALFRGLAGLSHACVAISPAVGDYLVSTTGIARNKVTVIPNGVFSPTESSVPRAELREAFGLRAASFVVGTVCRLDDDTHKRVSDLLRAMFLLNDLGNLELLIVGDGRQRQEFERLSAELGLEQRVRFAGYCDDVGSAYAVMDLFALASAREGFGLVVAEAMLAGLPVVATNVGGIRDIVDDGKTGILVPPFEPPELARAIRRLYESAALRLAMANAGTERARERFGAERYARDVSELYQRVLGLDAGG
jgi:L-malate glycosyltransferase